MIRPRAAAPRHALARMGIAAAAGALCYGALARRIAMREATLVSWDVAGFVLLALSWGIIAQSDARSTQKRAGVDDPGRTVVYAIVVLTSTASLLAATVLAGSARAPTTHLKPVVSALCLVTVALAWTMTHTAYTFRYAHLYYREDAEGVGGITVPGTAAPAYFDFAYFAFTIGMCFQVSDVCVTSPQIRAAVLLHALVSFAYNSLVLAFVLSLVFGLAA